ncbi:MAG: hydrogenase expression/formation protein HypE [Candidatus Eremiobacteraeota bacterium]|nr:hydrogenase expression/formation protein HypE [Candidatus Eremiobacteraeota bacterium]
MSAREENILMAHGSGGIATHRLVKDLFLPLLQNPVIEALDDAASLEIEGRRLFFTTDSFVVTPLVFPGGDIGKLSVCGTINDLAVCGAEPLYLSCSLIMEEGLSMAVLRKVMESLARTALDAGVPVVTGDTKVVEKGHADGLFITTSGIGIKRGHQPTGAIEAGDAVIISGTLGDHGVAVLSAREDLALESPITSDCAPLHRMTAGLLSGCEGVRFMRDPTRGGLATTANELVEGMHFGIKFRESAIPIKASVEAVCDLLGFDPLYLANEGKILVIIDSAEAQKALEALQSFPEGKDAAVIGEVTADHPGRVVIETAIGGTRILDMLAGEQLPRIC